MQPLLKTLTTAILILALLSAGCTDTGGGSVQNPTHTETTTQTETPTATEAATPVQTEAPWYIDKPGFGDAVVTDGTTLDGTSVHGVMVEPIGGGFDLYDVDTGEMRLNHQEFTSFDPYSELPDNMFQDFVDEYGTPAAPVVMEKIDTDSNGKLDTVAVKYVGSKGTLDFETEYKNSYWGLSAYIIDHLR